MIKNLIKKYESLSVQIKASFWFLICAFLQKGISFITTPVFTRLLTTAEYGQYNVFNSWMSVLTVIVTLNLYCGVFTRGLVKLEDDRKAFISSLQGLTLTLILFWTLIYFLFHEFWNQLFSLTTIQMVLMLQMLWTTAIFSFWSAEQRVDFKYRTLVLVTLFVSIAKPLVGIILVLNTEDKVTARIFGLAVVELVVYIVFFFRHMYNGKVFFSSKYWRYALTFNIPLIPHYLSMSVLNGADRIMIEKMVNASAAGIYSLAYSVSMIMTMFNTALLQTIEPWMYKKIKEKRITDISKVAYSAFVLIAFVNIALIAFAPEIITLFASEEYYDAIYVVPPVAMGVFFMFSYTFFAVFEFYYSKTKLIALATSIGAVLNIILNYVFIKIFGYYAAGYTTLVCYIIYAAFHYIFMKKICRMYLDNAQPYDTGIYLTIVIVFMIIGFAFLATYHYAMIRYLLIIGLLIAAFIKRKLILEFIRRIKGISKLRN